MSFRQARISHLSNGMGVIVDPVPHVETVALGVWVFSGSRVETPKRLGISHLLEHMAFKGTHRRSARKIVEDIESVGGFLNAYTSREQTVYHARLLKEDTALAIDVLADILQNSLFSTDELRREQDVIVQEIGESADSPDDQVFEAFQNVAFPDQPIGRPILGTEKSVRAIGSDDLFDHLAEFYRAGSVLLLASGAVDADAIADQAAKAFAGLPEGRRPDFVAASYQGGDARTDKELEQVHVAFGMEGVALNDDDLYTSQILNEIYGGGMSSRLFQEVREKRGLCYSIHSFSNAYSDTGLFGFYAGTSEASAGDLVPVALDELEALSRDVTHEELARAKAQVKSMILMGLESLHSRCEWAARYYERFGRILEPAEVIERIDAVAGDDMRRLAQGLLSGGRPALSALGPIGGLQDYDRFARRLDN